VFAEKNFTLDTTVTGWTILRAISGTGDDGRMVHAIGVEFRSRDMDRPAALLQFFTPPSEHQRFQWLINRT
jgi:hypothetical protein